MDSSQIQALMQELASPSLDMDEEQVENSLKCCAILEDMSAERCRQVIKIANKGPVLQVYMSDEWACDITKRVSSQHEDIRLSSRGKIRQPFVLERALVKCKRGDDVHFAVKIQRPRPLATKKCVDMWSAAIEFCPILALTQHKGIGIHIYLQDGLFKKPFGWRMAARHSLFWQPAHCPLAFEDDAARYIAELRDWAYATGCLAHTCSLALKWGLRPMVVGEAMLESVHISISALLRGSSGLFKCVPEFISTYVVCDLLDPDCPDDIYWLWTCLDVPPQLIDLFVRVNPQWTGDRLHVSARLSGAVDMISAVTTCIHSSLHWVDFSETRWVKVGQCGRKFVKSLCMGLDKLADIAMKDSAISKWHLGGFHKRCDEHVRQYLCTAAICARPTEAMLSELMEDDRFLLETDKCWDIMQVEHRYIEEAPMFFWESISALQNVDSHCYKTSCLECSLISLSYMHMDIFSSLSEAPLKYCIGDLDANIESLKTDDDITDPLSLKFKGLATLGFEEELKQGLELFRETSFTTIIVEQAHGSGAMMMRRHPALEMMSLTARMSIHNCRMLVSLSSLEKHLSRFELLLEKTDRQLSNVNKTGPRQMYVKELIAEVNSKRHMDLNRGITVRRDVFKKHGKTFGDLGEGQVAALRQKAAVYNARKIHTLDASREHIVDQMMLIRARQQEEQGQGVVNHMASVRFDSVQYDRFSELWQQYSKEQCRRLLSAPKAIPRAHEVILQEMIDKAAVPHAKAPDWLSFIVDLRDDFVGTAFYSDSQHGSGDVIFKLLLAIAQPRRAMFLECHRAKRDSSGMTCHGRYTFEGLRLVSHDQVPWADSADVWVIPDSWVQGSEVHTAGEAVPFGVFSRFLRRPAQTKSSGGGGRSGPRPRYDAELLNLLQLEFPWLTLEELMTMLNMHSPQASAPEPKASPLPRGASSSSAGSGGDGHGQAELAEDIVAQVHANLEALRAEVNEANQETRSYFALKALGGVWSVHRSKRITSDFQSMAKDKSIAGWCEKTTFPARKSYSTNLYGPQNARMLAEEVVRRGEYFFSAWIEAGSPVPFDSFPLALGYKSTSEYCEWFDMLPLSEPSWKAAYEIQEMVPLPLLE